MNLHQKLVEIRQAVGCLSKDQEGYDYNYVTGNQILSKVKDKMNELNVLLIPSTEVGEWTQYDYTTSTGKSKTDFVVWGPMTYTWIDGDNPEDKITIPWSYYGQQDDLSKAYGSALTYSERYFWLKMLGLPTDEDDPDGRQGEQKSGNRQGQKSGNKSAGGQKSGQGQRQDGNNFKSNPNKTINEKQVKRMFALAEGDKNLITKAAKEVVGHDDFNKVLNKDYDEVCKKIVAGSMADNEAEDNSEAPEEQKEQGANEDVSPPITKAQINALVSLAENFGYTNHDMKALINERYNKQGSQELTSAEADDLIAEIEAREID